jgi:hypothetical protein
MSGQRLILTLGIVVLLLMYLFPPYFGIDVESEGAVHGSVGFHPLWRAPNPEYVYEALTSHSPQNVDPARLSSFQSRVNKVMLGFHTIIVVVVVGVVLIIHRKRTKGA